MSHSDARCRVNREIDRATAHKLGLGETTPDGAFYARVDGKNVGEDGRAFWPTRGDALDVADRFLSKLTESDHVG